MASSGPPPPYPGADNAYPQPPNPAYPVYPPGYPADPKMAGQPGAIHFQYGPPPNAYPGQPGFQQPYGPGYPPAQGYGQPIGGYGQQQSAQTTVVVAQPAVTVIQTFRESPVHTRCPHCQAEIVTATHYETGTFTWIVCLIVCLIGCDLGCCLIPFCVDGCKDVIHSCPNCRQQVARWSRM